MMEEINAHYVGGSLDGKKVRPSLVRYSLHKNLPICHGTNVFDDYWMQINESYLCKKKDGKVVCELIETTKHEINGR